MGEDKKEAQKEPPKVPESAVNPPVDAVITYLTAAGETQHANTVTALWRENSALNQQQHGLLLQLGRANEVLEIERQAHNEALTRLTNFTSVIEDLQRQRKTQDDINKALRKKNEILAGEVETECLRQGSPGRGGKEQVSGLLL